MNLIRILRHKLKIILWYLNRPKTPLDFFGVALVSLCGRWRTEVNPVFSYFGMFEILRQRGFSGQFLELGGGYSTVILTNILDMTKVSLTSIDLNPNKYHWILNSARSKRDFLATFKSVQKPTVTLHEAFVGLELLRLKLVKFDRNQLKSVLAKYVNSDLDDINTIYNCIVSESGANIKNLIMRHHAYTEDLKFYESKNYETGTGYCSSLIDLGYKPSAIFFDCGEISSVGEWIILADSIRVGGYALLHDVYYPKSIKNFLVATYIELSEEWEILYRDSISTQGAIVAVKMC